MRLGIYGGTFDPVHVAHLALAEHCREQARLDQVLFVPAARPPHKLEQPLTSFHHRVEMLELAIAGYPPFQISMLEKDRPGPSYTVETLRLLRDERPADELFLILGSDSLQDLPTWYQPEEIAKLATLLVVQRSGHPLPAQPLAAFRHVLVKMPLLDVASRDLRARVRTGSSIRYLVPRSVECYLATHKLYSS